MKNDINWPTVAFITVLILICLQIFGWFIDDISPKQPTTNPNIVSIQNSDGTITQVNRTDYENAQNEG